MTNVLPLSLSYNGCPITISCSCSDSDFQFLASALLFQLVGILSVKVFLLSPGLFQPVEDLVVGFHTFTR